MQLEQIKSDKMREICSIFERDAKRITNFIWEILRYENLGNSRADNIVTSNHDTLNKSRVMWTELIQLKTESFCGPL
jgi:hypothetical protein